MQQQHCLVKEKEVEYVDGALEKVDGSNLLGKPELYTPSLVRRGIDLCFEMKLRLCRWKRKCWGGGGEGRVPCQAGLLVSWYKAAAVPEEKETIGPLKAFHRGFFRVDYRSRKRIQI